MPLRLPSFKLLTLPIALLLFFTSQGAFALSQCPNTQVGTITQGSSTYPGFYSDCSMTAGSSTAYHLTMFKTGNVISLNGYANDGTLTPAVVGNEPFGAYDFSTLYTLDMGASYSGDCSEQTYLNSEVDAAAVTGNVYCGFIENTDGDTVFLRGTWTGTAPDYWSNYQILTNAVGVGTPLPEASSATPVPVLPLWGLLSLAGLVGLFGFRKFR